MRGAERTPVSWDISGWRWSEGGVAAGPRHCLFNVEKGNVERTVIVEAVEGGTQALLMEGLAVPTKPDRDGNPPLVEAGGTVWFAGRDFTHGGELFSLDLEDEKGVAKLVREVNVKPERTPHPLSSVRESQLLYTAFNASGEAIVGAYEPAGEVTHYPVSDMHPYALNMTDAPGHGGLYFTTGSDLWHLDYEVKTTPDLVVSSRPHDIGASAADQDESFVIVQGRMLYASEDSGRWALFSLASPGDEPVRLLEDVAGHEGFVQFGDLAYVVRPSNARNEIWETDGTPEGTRLLYREPEETGNELLIHEGRPGTLVVHALFGTGGGWWFIDLSTREIVVPVLPEETLRGRFYMRNLNTGVIIQASVEGEPLRSLWMITFENPRFERLIVTTEDWVHTLPETGATVTRAGKHVFVAGSPEHGQELWQLEGLKLTRLTDLRPGEEDGVVSTELAHRGRYVYFVGSEEATGDELYLFDMETGEVRLAFDLRQGLLSSLPRDLRVLGDELLFWAASDLSAGVALHAIDLPSAPVPELPLSWVTDGSGWSLRLQPQGEKPVILYQSHDLRSWMPVEGMLVPAGEDRRFAPKMEEERRVFYRLGPAFP